MPYGGGGGGGGVLGKVGTALGLGAGAAALGGGLMGGVRLILWLTSYIILLMINS
jgi:hypothetical protein